MRAFVSFVCILITLTIGYADQPARLGKLLSRVYPLLKDQDTALILIFFTSEDPIVVNLSAGMTDVVKGEVLFDLVQARRNIVSEGPLNPFISDARTQNYMFIEPSFQYY